MDAGDVPPTSTRARTMRSTGYYEGDDEAKVKGYAVDEKFACEESDGRIYVNEMIRNYLHRRCARAIIAFIAK